MLFGSKPSRGRISGGDGRQPVDRMWFLFTMSKLLRRLLRLCGRDDKRNAERTTLREWIWHGLSKDRLETIARPLVEPDGIEPTTSCLQSTRSPN
jgi:hypothetical protein